MFRMLQKSGRGPDGYPLDVHPPKLPLPPQDPIWTQGAASTLSDRAALLAHAQAICGVPISREITPELYRAGAETAAGGLHLKTGSGLHGMTPGTRRVRRGGGEARTFYRSRSPPRGTY